MELLMKKHSRKAVHKNAGRLNRSNQDANLRLPAEDTGDPTWTWAFVPREDRDMYGVDREGLYAFDDNHRAVDGPRDLTREELARYRKSFRED
jgi:hypothetical protein